MKLFVVSFNNMLFVLEFKVLIYSKGSKIC